MFLHFNTMLINTTLTRKKECFSWIRDFVAGNTTPTLNEMNGMFSKRHYGAVAFIFTMMALGLVGNLSVIWIYSTKFKPSNYRTYTLWLASMDIINCFYTMPFLLYYHFHYLIFPSPVYCKTGRFCLVFTANASAFLLVVIACDRYRHICKPLKWQFSTLNIKICCICAVILALFISWPNLVLFGEHTVDNLPFNINGTRCWQEDKFRSPDYLSGFYITLSGLSLCISLILLITYMEILRHLVLHMKNCKDRNVEPKITQTRKTTLTLLAVTTAFVVSAIPHNIFVVILLLDTDFHCHMSFKEGYYFYTFVWSILINNSINPFIYGFSDSRFRENFKSFFNEFVLKKFNIHFLCNSETTYKINEDNSVKMRVPSVS